MKRTILMAGAFSAFLGLLGCGKKELSAAEAIKPFSNQAAPSGVKASPSVDVYVAPKESPHVYDKAKYHDSTIEQFGLSEEHAANHTVFFLRWLIENNLMSAFFSKECDGVLVDFRSGKKGIHEVYEWWDCCLIDDMLSADGNKFAMHYFDFDKGQYLQDYKLTLQGSLPSEFHVDYTEENYQRMKVVMDRRYQEWKSSGK